MVTNSFVFGINHSRGWNSDPDAVDVQEDKIGRVRPSNDVKSISVPDKFYDTHESLLRELSERYNCNIDDLTPIINLIRA